MKRYEADSPDALCALLNEDWEVSGCRAETNSLGMIRFFSDTETFGLSTYFWLELKQKNPDWATPDLSGGLLDVPRSALVEKLLNIELIYGYDGDEIRWWGLEYEAELLHLKEKLQDSGLAVGVQWDKIGRKAIVPLTTTLDVKMPFGLYHVRVVVEVPYHYSDGKILWETGRGDVYVRFPQLKDQQWMDQLELQSRSGVKFEDLALTDGMQAGDYEAYARSWIQILPKIELVKRMFA